MRNKNNNVQSNLAVTIQPSSIPTITEIIRRCFASYNKNHPKSPIPFTDMRDIEQTILGKVWKKKDTFDPSIGSLATWVWTIAIRSISDYWADRANNENWASPKPNVRIDAVSGNSICVADKSDFESDLIDAEESNRKVKWLHDHIELLSDRRRFVVEEILKETDRKEIARQLGCTTDAVNKLFFDATKALTEMLNAERAAA